MDSKIIFEQPSLKATARQTGQSTFAKGFGVTQQDGVSARKSLARAKRHIIFEENNKEIHQHESEELSMTQLEKTEEPVKACQTQVRLRLTGFCRPVFRFYGTAAQRHVFSSLRSMRSFVVNHFPLAYIRVIRGLNSKFFRVICVIAIRFAHCRPACSSPASALPFASLTALLSQSLSPFGRLGGRGWFSTYNSSSLTYSEVPLAQWVVKIFNSLRSYLINILLPCVSCIPWLASQYSLRFCLSCEALANFATLSAAGVKKSPSYSRPLAFISG